MKKQPLYVFLIFFFLVGVTSFNITEDWATAFFQALAAGFIFMFVFVVGYSSGFQDGKAKGYEKALEDLKPFLKIDNNNMENGLFK